MWELNEGYDQQDPGFYITDADMLVTGILICEDQIDPHSAKVICHKHNRLLDLEPDHPTLKLITPGSWRFDQSPTMSRIIAEDPRAEVISAGGYIHSLSRADAAFMVWLQNRRSSYEGLSEEVQEKVLSEYCDGCECSPCRCHEREYDYT